MWDFCLGIEYTSIYAGTDSNPTYGYGEQFAHLAQRPQQKFLNYFYFFLALVGLLFCCFFFLAKSCLGGILLSQQRMGSMRHSCAIITPPQNFIYVNFISIYFTCFFRDSPYVSCTCFFASSLHLLYFPL